MNIYYLICGCQLTVSYRFWVRTEKMEAKFYIALLIVGLISTALGKFFVKMRNKIGIRSRKV